MKVLSVAIVLIVFCFAANADIITYVTPAGTTTSGGAVDALATLVTGAGTLSITLTDLQANPKSFGQLISGLDFVLSNGATTGILTSSSGQEITVNSNGTFTLGGIVATGWTLNSFGGGLQLIETGPSHLIIGPPNGSGKYSNANGSIAGSGPHNPFLDETATFTLSIPGVTESTTITSATFVFGGSPGDGVIGARQLTSAAIAPSGVPEPASGILLGGVLLALARKFRSSKSRLAKN